MREYDLSNARWRKSSYSGGSGGEACIEITYDFPGVVPVRDSKLAAASPVLLIPAPAWSGFLTSLR
ncbi:protein of unknown function [Streptomyces sp. cf386]|uniref:DUF397 domain-containing protein n=1 Tax=Streptomyces sp. cf386 TaxID=1761904 RepID=UPI00088FC4AD|nr:DUF397 domain-containing protein [Streptomyces sp. cf386]SDO89455.1 protein of unknown function [Streptomyces sp. cf386]